MYFYTFCFRMIIFTPIMLMCQVRLSTVFEHFMLYFIIYFIFYFKFSGETERYLSLAAEGGHHQAKQALYHHCKKAKRCP